MTERWRSGLDELSRVPMSEGLRERAREGSSMPDPVGPGVTRRVAIAVLALGVFAAGSFGVWDLLRPAGPAERTPAAGEAETSQRVFGEATCAFESTPQHKFDIGVGTQDSPFLHYQAEDPVGACQDLWRTASDTPAPEMIACVPNSAAGHISVVEVSSSPDGTCSGIDASPLPDGWDANLDRWRAVEDAIGPYFPSQGGMTCQRDLQTAVDVWRNALDANSFPSWKVVVDDANADRPCFNYDVNYDTMEVTIVHDTVS
ncbi:MAG: hypothetical protein M3O88_06215 [Actinomycetota bacterium]|nr:hypothetical protein [Actinomycetota bacterium]